MLRCTGEFVGDRREGGGVFKWADDTEYAGEWKDDCRSVSPGWGVLLGRMVACVVHLDSGLGIDRHGLGVETWPDGREFEGSYVGGLKHGPGLFIWNDGARYEGEYRSDLRHG